MKNKFHNILKSFHTSFIEILQRYLLLAFIPEVMSAHSNFTYLNICSDQNIKFKK